MIVQNLSHWFYFDEVVKQNPYYYRDMGAIVDFRTCGSCRRVHERRMLVPPSGDPSSRLIFCGQDPGNQEEIHGGPFWPTTMHGKILDKYIAFFGATRATVYVTNALFCRGRNSRPPEADEFLKCAYWKTKEVDWCNRLVVVMGKFAHRMFFGDWLSYDFCRDKIVCFEPLRSFALTMHHPAYLMRQDRKQLDIQLVKLRDNASVLSDIMRKLENAR